MVDKIVSALLPRADILRQPLGPAQFSFGYREPLRPLDGPWWPAKLKGLDSPNIF
jgi:hypothetical protein